MKHLILSIIFLISQEVFCQKTIITKELKKEPESKIIVPELKIPDRLNIVLPEKYFEKPASDWKKDYLPSIITLGVGIFTFFVGILSLIVNWRISKKIRENSKETTLLVLSENKILKEKELKASLNIKNRQEWMNQFREVATQFIALALIQSVAAHSNSDKDREEAIKIVELCSRAELLLHPNREFEKDAINEFNQLLTIIGDKRNLKPEEFNVRFHASKDKLTELARKILEKNWQKMNALV